MNLCWTGKEKPMSPRPKYSGIASLKQESSKVLALEF